MGIITNGSEYVSEMLKIIMAMVPIVTVTLKFTDFEVCMKYTISGMFFSQQLYMKLNIMDNNI